MSKDPQARKADQLATELTGTGAHREELYSIASRIFEGVITRSGGDPAALQKLIEEAKQDPARFMATLPPEEQRQIRELAKKIESSTAAGRSGVPMKRP